MAAFTTANGPTTRDTAKAKLNQKLKYTEANGNKTTQLVWVPSSGWMKMKPTKQGETDMKDRSSTTSDKAMGHYSTTTGQSMLACGKTTLRRAWDSL